MNKGRNLAILMACLLTLSLLTFLTRTFDSNRTAVVDQVRYIQGDTTDGTVHYDFYFVGSRVMEGELTPKGEGWELVLFDRIPPDAENYELVPYGYTYEITGSSLKNACVTWRYADGVDSFEKQPFELFSQRVFKTMLFGRQPLLAVWQAVVVAVIAAVGALVIGYAEEIWHFHRKKGPDEDPKWEELSLYKRIGGGIMGFAALLLILFVIC